MEARRRKSASQHCIDRSDTEWKCLRVITDIGLLSFDFCHRLPQKAQGG